MNPNIWIGLVCVLIVALALLAFTMWRMVRVTSGLIREVMDRSFKAGYARGRAEADGWWQEQGRQVDQARQKMWREEESA